MDDFDHKLVALLRTDARRPVSSLATALKVSRATVRTRIDKLLAKGVIQGFTVTLAARARTSSVRAIMLVEVEGQIAEKVIKSLYGFPENQALHTTNGRWDIVAELEAETLEAFDEILRKIRLIEGIASTETNILLSSRK